MNLRTMTPSQIDAIAFPLMEREFGARMGYFNARTSYAEAVRAPEASFEHRHLAERERWMNEAKVRLDEAKRNLAPYEAEFERRGGWTRFPHTITAGAGHFHRGFDCSTCYPTTQYGYHHDYSGLTERQLVDKVGSEACTVCFPWAPTTEAWGRVAKASAAAKVSEKLAKWQKGYDVRAKKVINVEKRLAKHLADPHHKSWCLGTVSLMHRDPATGKQVYGPTVPGCDGERELRWAKQELARWEAKKPS